MVMGCVVCRRFCDVWPQLSFHSFPLKDNERLEKWCTAMNFQKENVKKHWRICCAHFSLESYTELSLKGKKKILKKNAVPSIIDVLDAEIAVNNFALKNEAIVVEETFEMKKEVTSVESFEGFSHDKRISRKRPAADVFTKSSECNGNLENTKSRRSEDVIHSSTLLKGRLEEAQEKISDLEKKLNAARARNYRLNKTVKTFRSLMVDLKRNKFLTETTAMKIEAILILMDGTEDRVSENNETPFYGY